MSVTRSPHASRFRRRELHRQPAAGLEQASMLRANPALHVIGDQRIGLRSAPQSRLGPCGDAVGLAVDRGDTVAVGQEIRESLALDPE